MFKVPSLGHLGCPGTSIFFFFIEAQRKGDQVPFCEVHSSVCYYVSVAQVTIPQVKTQKILSIRGGPSASFLVNAHLPTSIIDPDFAPLELHIRGATQHVLLYAGFFPL